MKVGLAQASVKDSIEGLEVLDAKSNESVQVAMRKVNETQVEYTITFKSKRGLFDIRKKMLKNCMCLKLNFFRNLDAPEHKSSLKKQQKLMTLFRKNKISYSKLTN